MRLIKFILILLGVSFYIEEGKTQPSFKANPIEITFSLCDHSTNCRTKLFTTDSIIFYSKDKEYSIQFIRGHFFYGEKKEFIYSGSYKKGYNPSYNESLNIDGSQINLELWRTNNLHNLSIVIIRKFDDAMIVCIDNLREARGTEDVIHVDDYVICFNSGFYEMVNPKNPRLRLMDDNEVSILKKANVFKDF